MNANGVKRIMAVGAVLLTVAARSAHAAPPTADAGPDITIEVGYPVPFDGGDSVDGNNDDKLEVFEWDFDDNGKKGICPRPHHIYTREDNHTVTLTVYDYDGVASAPDTKRVFVRTSTPPTADAGGPYSAGVGGPPAYFDGTQSSDCAEPNIVQGIVDYSWDADITVDSDRDGNPGNDRDAEGDRGFYTYSREGIITGRLTVKDGAGQTDSDEFIVHVKANEAPHVICPRPRNRPGAYHYSYDNRQVRLKGIVRDTGSLTYQWDFGDGSPPTAKRTVTDKYEYEIEATHSYTGKVGTVYRAYLTVWDSGGMFGHDDYVILIKNNDIPTRSDMAIEDGLWWLHKDQNRSTGRFGHPYGYSYDACSQGSSLQAFLVNGHNLSADPCEDPYIETVQKGFDYMFKRLRTKNFAGHDGDSNGNGFGIETRSGRPIYEGGMVMDAIAASQAPTARARTGSSGIKGETFYDILTDMCDMYSWGQADANTGNYRGGWRYGWNNSHANHGGRHSDNSACQWAAIGYRAAEDNFGIVVPQFVKDENKKWLVYSYWSRHPNGYFGYTGKRSSWSAQTPSGMVQLSFAGYRRDDAMWTATENATANHWPAAGQDWNEFYSAYAVKKALLAARPSKVITFSSGMDWYNDEDRGLRKIITDMQRADGSWYPSGRRLKETLFTSWGVMMLMPALFVQPPKAGIQVSPMWAYDKTLTFSGENSYHIDDYRRIVLYEWDLNDDGAYDDVVTTNAVDPRLTISRPDPDPDPGDPPVFVTVRLRVTDDNVPPQSDTIQETIQIGEPPIAPFVRMPETYYAIKDRPITFDAGASFDVDLGDAISCYEWDLDLNGDPDVILNAPTSTLTRTYTETGVDEIRVRVRDYGVINWQTNATTRQASQWAYAKVVIDINRPPVSDPGGPYVVMEGEHFRLSGARSSDPNHQPLTYMWDFDLDGTPESYRMELTLPWGMPGIHTIALIVSDGEFSHTNTTILEVIAVDDNPTFTLGPDIEVNAGNVARTFTNWVTGITPGDVYETNQTVQFFCECPAPEMFEELPSITPDGTLTFTPTVRAMDTTQVEVRARDSNNNWTGPYTFNITLIGDRDNDGILDQWEQDFFHGTNVADAVSDFDDDGASDLEEFRAGTDPTDPTSRLGVGGFGRDPFGDMVTITWSSVPGINYVVFRAESIMGPYLDVSGVVVGEPGATTSFTDFFPPKGAAFYKVRVHGQ